MINKVIIQQPIPRQLWNGADILIDMAEHIYTVLLIANSDPDGTERDAITYILDSDWLGFKPESSCNCERCELCHQQRQWANMAYGVLNDILNSFVPPIPTVEPSENCTVRLLPPNGLVVPVDYYHSVKLEAKHASSYCRSSKHIPNP